MTLTIEGYDLCKVIMGSVCSTDLRIGARILVPFYLPPVFENGGRYCFGVRRRLRRLRRLRGLRGCFALYLGCY